MCFARNVLVYQKIKKNGRTDYMHKYQIGKELKSLILVILHTT